MKAKTWNGHSINDGTNYKAVLGSDFYGIPKVEAKSAQRQGYWPIIGGLERPGRKMFMRIFIRSLSSRESLTNQLNQWFDPDDETPKKLLVEDYAGGNDRYIYAICTELKEVEASAGMEYVVSLVTHGDAFWRENTASTSSWSITATGQTKVVTNNGYAEAYPLLKIKPTSAKTGDYAYKRWVGVGWWTSRAMTYYPVDIGADAFDTAALVTASKMQADGDDLRVFVDGVEVNRWLDGINTTTTKVWINLDFQAQQSWTLAAAIASSGAVDTIDVSEDTSGVPSSGILAIESEIFVYTGKNNALKRFTGVTRAQKGSSMAAHALTTTVSWIQHDVWIKYGNATATSPSSATGYDTYKPAFELDHSTNTSWVYETFRSTSGARTGGWQTKSINGSPVFYGGNRGASADPWVEAGLQVGYPFDEGRIYLYNPCGITDANFTNGEKYYWQIYWLAKIQSSLDGNTWADEYDIAAPSTESTWESWSRNEALASGSMWVGLWQQDASYIIGSGYLEAADCTLTLNSSQTPTAGMYGEQGNYSLACKITNNTTGEAINISFIADLNEELEVDTDDKTVIYLKDNSNQFQALTLVGGVRRDWLPLGVGNNTLQFDDTGTAAVTVTINWEERHYQ